MFELVVNHPFAHYTVGQEITDPHEVEQILGSHFRNFVVKRPAKEVPEPTAVDVEPHEH